MANLVTLAQLRSGARLYADQRRGGAGVFVEDADVNFLINLACREYYDLLVSLHGHEYFEDEDTSITTSVGVATYPLPSNFYRLLSVHLQWSDTCLEQVRGLNNIADRDGMTSTTWAQRSCKAYRLRGSLLEYFPTPTSEVQTILRYVPTFTDLANDGDTIDDVNGWSNLIMLKVACKLKAIANESMGQLNQLYEREHDRVQEMAADRAVNEPTQLRDIRADWAGVAPIVLGGGSGGASSLPVSSIVRTVDVLASLRSVNSSSVVYFVRGHTTVGDGGGGFFRYASGASAGTYTDDNAMVIVPTGGDGSAAWLRRTMTNGEYDLRWFGAFGGGVTVETTQVQAAIDYVKAHGGTLVDGSGGTYLVASLAVGGAAARWAFRGAGIGKTIFKRNSGGTVMNCSSSSFPFTLEDFSVNGNYAATAASASHGISIGYVSGLRLKRLRVYDYKSVGILVYADYADRHTYRDNIICDCEADGRNPNTLANVGEDGILIGSMDYSGIEGCRAIGNQGSPGFGIQLKDACWHSWITDCYAEKNASGGGFGNDQASADSGCRWCTVKSLRCYDNTYGWTASYDSHNQINGLTIHQNNNSGQCVRLEDGSHDNSYSGITVYDLDALQAVIYCKGTATDNTFEVDTVNSTNGGKIAWFDSTSTRNTVVCKRTSNPAIHANGVPGEVDFNANGGGSASTTNGYMHRGYQTFETLTLASDTATPRNIFTEALLVDGEGAAADDFITLTWTAVEQQGREISIKAVSAGHAITVKNTGSFKLAGGANFVLNDQSYTIQLRFHNNGKWCEIARASNS